MSSPRLSPSGEQPRLPARAPSPPEIFHKVSLTSSQYTQEILAILQEAYLDSSSGSYFQYNQVTLVNNVSLLEKLKGCRLDLEGKGYSKEELAESFAFLLFETEDKAKTVCQNGLKVGNSDITTLGDPLKGVYLCKYSDFLHPTPWYHGKCGYILIFKIIKGRVKSMIENYTADLTGPSASYNCHVSANSNTVSSITSHFQAFELTQYYLYEFGQCDVLQYPRQIYPYAVVAFQYCDNKCMMSKSTEIEFLVPEIQAVYHPWKGQLINKGKVINVALKSNGSPLMPVVLPVKLEIEYVMSIGELKGKLPQAVFQREYYGLKEVCLEGLYCSWYELVEYRERGESPQLVPLVDEMKKKNLAIVKCLPDQGLLILFSASDSCFTGGSGQTTHNVLQAVFIFKAARISHLKEMNQVARTLCQNRITLLLPGISYAVMKGLKSTDAQATPRNKLVEDHLVEYFKMTPEEQSMSSKGVTTDNDPPAATGAAPNKGVPPIPGDYQRTRISQLSPYFADPASYTLATSTVLKLQGNSLNLCQDSGAKRKDLSHPPASKPKPPKAAFPRNKRIPRSRKAQGKDAGPVASTSPCCGTTSRSTAQSQTDGEPGKTVGRANPISKPVACKAISRGAIKVKRKAAKPLLAGTSNKPGAKTETVGGSTSAADSDVPSSEAASAALVSLRYSTRSQSAHNIKRTLGRSGKGSPTEPPAPPGVTKKNLKAAGVPSQTDSKQAPAARKAVGTCRGTAKPGLGELSKQYTETGINTEQVSRYGVCTWNIVENASEHEPASLQPLSSGTESNLLCEKKTLEVAGWAPQEGIDTNEGETDALNILADLAINAAITAVLKSKQQCILTVHQSPEMCATNKATSVGSNEQLNYCPNLLDNHSDCLPHTELRVQNISPFVAESHQDGSREFSENQLPHSTAPLSLECPPCVPSVLPNCETSQVHNSQTRVAKELARRSLASSRSSHPLGDHSYSRPPSNREPLCLAVANPVPSEKEFVVCQYTSLYTESEKEFSAASDLQNTTHASPVQSEVVSKDEERTLVGRVLPFRREDTCWANVTNSMPTPQKNNGAMGKYGQIADYTSVDSAQSRFDEVFRCSRTVHEEKDTVKVTFEWKGPYLFQWDSKYTNDSLEKSVNRALHGPWDPTISETMKEVKLILHMWIGLFYTKSSMMLQTSMRQVQECCETPEPAAGDLHKELAGIGEPAFSESGSESAASEKQQMAGVIISSVIKRIEKKSNLVTSWDSDAPFYRETLPCVSSQQEEEYPQGSDSSINADNTQGPEAPSPHDGLTHTAHISAGEEATNDLQAARLEHESQEPNLYQSLTPLSGERSATDFIQYNGVQDTMAGFLAERDLVGPSQTDNREVTSVIKQTESIQQHTQDEPEVLESPNPSAQPSTCPVSVTEEPRSVDDVDEPVIESGELGIIRQSSVIKEVLGIQLPAEEPSQSQGTMSSSNLGASGSGQKLNKSSENGLQTKRFNNLTASEGIENTTCTEDLGTIKNTLATVSQDKFGGVNHSDAASQSFPFTKDVSSHINTIGTSESSNVIMHNCSRTLVSSNPLDNTPGPLVKGSTCSYVECCTDVQLLNNDTEAQRDRISVRKLQGEGGITSDSDPEFPGSLKCVSSGDECRSQIKPQAILRQNSVEILSAEHTQKEFETMNQCKDCNTASERSDCNCTVSKESAFTFRHSLEGSDIEIQKGARDFSESKKMPRMGLSASSQKRKRKRKVYREIVQCFSDTDSEYGDFREQWDTRDGHLQMRTIDRNCPPHVFEENNIAEEMSDFDAPVLPVIKIPDPFGKPKIYQNFTVTAEVQQKPDRHSTCERITRTFCNWPKESNAPQLLGQWNSRARSRSNINPTEKIMNLEYIRFSQHLHNLVNRARAAPYPSLFSSSRETALRRRRNIQAVSGGRLIGGRNPLTVTISCRKVDQSSGRRLRNESQIAPWTNAEDETWQQGDVAFYKPKSFQTSFKNNRKRPRSQTHAMSRNAIEPVDRTPSKSHSTGEKGSLFADELLNVKRKRYKELQGDGRKRIDPFLCLITELYSDLHQNLNEVVKESWKGTYKFYVSETNSDPFFKEIKEFLKNEGHVEIGPLGLSMLQPRHPGKVLVIIRNEDISAHLHQIPHLMALKQMPCVQFAGVDSPGDIKDQTFQELFSSGGIIVSDGTVLDNMTPEHLQQISAILEQLSAERKWKWMIHFKELKKLKKTAREDNIAKRKISLLTRKIAANVVEVLPFHECDSGQEKPDHLSCLMKLQVQKISSRFLVFLTGRPENQEVFAQSGILVTDINSFTKSLRMLTTPIQSTLATRNARLAEGGHSSETQLESSFGKNTGTQNSPMPPILF
ncbi:protein TASOR 2-like isoform X2 [Carcharodon carcharias]|uniref:protein TASOR 2-like isoform X2 n=1 Tax=Carcharodon carcharias TaxID=13397 RepID=UPI001B7EC8D0|nr:protein TASOR 2-like isoform X2 [Carcharodon carcharias]